MKQYVTDKLSSLSASKPHRLPASLPPGLLASQPHSFITIRLADTADKNAWNTYVLNHPEGLGYQLFGWKEAVQYAYRFKGYYLLAELNGGIKGILPLIYHKLPLKKGVLISLPYCDAGGPLADTTEISHSLIEKALEIAKDINATRVIIRAASRIGELPDNMTLNRQKVRMTLNLPENSDILLKSFKAKLRSQVRKPVHEGLKARIGGEELIDEFYPVFSENMRDLGSPVHSKKWLKSVLSFIGKQARVGLVCLPDGSPAAGGVILCHPRTVSLPWASSLRRYNRWNPNMLLYWSFLKFAADNGHEIFDFGRSTPWEGTFRFKKQWGAEPSALHWVRFKTDINGTLMDNIEPETSKVKKTKSRETAEKIYSRLPVSVAHYIGSLTRKYISL